MSNGPYTQKFFSNMSGGSRASAAVVVPILYELVGPRSVVDVGCGTGCWLAEFAKMGVENFLGTDGDYVERSALEIPADRFVERDLTRPFGDLGSFDIAISFEVAEHLPPEVAVQFVNCLTSLSGVVAFSAAVPNQGGTNHLNEQWQSFWSEIFRQRGYVAFDCVRPYVASDQRVAWFYRQNLIVYARRDAPSFSRIEEAHKNRPILFDLVSPDLLHIATEEPGMRRACRTFARALRNRFLKA